LSGRESIVPNEKLITERIENLSLADPRILLSTDVTVGYDSDVDRVQKILLDAAHGTDRVIADPEAAARLVKFGADGLEFVLQFWIADPNNGQMNVKSDVNLRILKGLREAGIEIPFPQREVRITSSTTAATG
jgi:small-conductance mechanosensitive channel